MKRYIKEPGGSKLIIDPGTGMGIYDPGPGGGYIKIQVEVGKRTRRLTKVRRDNFDLGTGSGTKDPGTEYKKRA